MLLAPAGHASLHQAPPTWRSPRRCCRAGGAPRTPATRMRTSPRSTRPAETMLVSRGTVPIVEIMTSAGPAHVTVQRPAGRPALLAVLTHGAGGTPDTPDVLAVRDAAREFGAVTALVTQPYRVRGARAPGSVVKQDGAWTEIVATLNAGNLPLVQGGRSNGARVACRTARQVRAIGVIALAFPLHPPGHPGSSRDGE